MKPEDGAAAVLDAGADTGRAGVGIGRPGESGYVAGGAGREGVTRVGCGAGRASAGVPRVGGAGRSSNGVSSRPSR
ncbi:hypothetical protein [Actinoplanes sp. M2I2]|uniref:hypothetical protein n=1 Tax=Actinoplanes sp. M2I2 TaxID=1734444 RepID=UPI00202253C7|nr:hypothetical protein [Actinoplanes sp. M2I2]